MSFKQLYIVFTLMQCIFNNFIMAKTKNYNKIVFKVFPRPHCKNFTTRAPDPGNNTGFECTLKDGDEVKKDILRGKHLRIASFKRDWPLSFVEKDSNGVLKGDGIAFQIIETLRKQFGFSYSIVVPNKDVLGDEKTGILELLHNRVQ